MSAIGKIAGGILGAGDPAEAASQASRAQVGETRRQFDITQQQLDPYRQAGLSALNMQLALMGLPQVGAQEMAPAQTQAQGGGNLFRRFGATAREAQQPTPQAGVPQFTQEQAMAGLMELPGQRFLRERQEQALLRQQAALGGLGGGAVRTALQQQATGFAQQDLQNQLARLAALSGRGQQAAAQLGGLGAEAAGQIGQARASGILGAQQAQAQQAQQGLGMLGSIAAPFLFGVG